MTQIAIPILLVNGALGLHGQSLVPPAPLQLTSAHKIFVSNLTDTNNAIAQRAYADFYASLTKRNRFQLVGQPTSADIVVEFSAAPNAPKIEWGSPLLKVRVLDPKTQTVLWSATEIAENINTSKSVADKILTRTADQLAEDFDAAVQQRPTVHSQKKGRFQQEQE